MVFVSADETLMLHFFLFKIHSLSYNCVWDNIVCMWLLCYKAEKSFSYGKKWFGYIKDVSSKSAGCLGISRVVESVLVGRTRGTILHLSKCNCQRIEPSPISIQTVPFKSVASIFQVKRSRTYATTSLKILSVSFPGSAVFFSTTAREGWDSPRAKKSLFLENSSPLSSSLPWEKKKKEKIST